MHADSKSKKHRQKSIWFGEQSQSSTIDDIYISSAFIYHFYYYYLGAGFNLSINTFIFFSPIQVPGVHIPKSQKKDPEEIPASLSVLSCFSDPYILSIIHPYSILVTTSDRWSDGGGAVTVYFFTLSLLNSAPLYSVLSSQ